VRQFQFQIERFPYDDGLGVQFYFAFQGFFQRYVIPESCVSYSDFHHPIVVVFNFACDDGEFGVEIEPIFPAFSVHIRDEFPTRVFVFPADPEQRIVADGGYVFPFRSVLDKMFWFR